MKPYENLSHLKEKEYTAEELAKSIEAVMQKHFSKSNHFARVSSSLGKDHKIYMAFTVGNKGQYVNNIAENDISMTKAFIWDVPETGIMEGKYTFDPSQGGSILVKPTEKYVAFSSVKVGLRKKTGTPDQILKHIDNYFAKLKKALKDNTDNIPDEHLSLLKGNF